MPPKSLAPDTRVTVDRATNTIVLTRTFTAPREDVFEAWTQPEHVACWWDASGAPLSVCEIDLRPDGAFRFVHQGQPDVPPFSGVYREIVHSDRLVFTEVWDEDWTGGEALVTMTFVEHAGKTALTQTVLYSSRAARDGALKTGMERGVEISYDRLASLPPSLHARPKEKEASHS